MKVQEATEMHISKKPIWKAVHLQLYSILEQAKLWETAERPVVA